MKKFLLIFAALFACMSISTVDAQELRMRKYGFWENWSMSGAIGGNMTFADEYKSIKAKNWGPEAWISLNKDWSPVMGTRLQLGWGQNNVLTFNENLDRITPTLLQNLALRPNRLDAGLDFTINPINLFNYNYDRRFNLLAIVGLGYSHTFEKNFTTDQKVDADYLNVDGLKKNNYIVPKVGIQVNYRVSDPVIIFLEGDFKAYNDKLDDIVNTAQYDGNVTLMAGITYRFKNKDGERGIRYIPSYDQADIDNLNNKINEQRAIIDSLMANPVKVFEQVVVKENVITKEIAPMTITFALDSYKVEDRQMANIENVGLFLKDNPDVKISVVGYADAETGTPNYNKKLSIKRAETVADILKGKYGISADRLTVVGEGDQVQQYKENDWNRAVIFVQNN